ncbi:Protein CBG06471 [Caenorhabditis briggsae]|uniref:Protein CBG06471 n=1 Tax=Caenorhabditis briggsae TaxID=6238 RepID=A8X2A8_CAEBR|nr:Protein CBG06471 [Caenorhabditis briggsae]CAP26768.1 Protein CBG06471 [Caenorhabditis briggsae]
MKLLFSHSSIFFIVLNHIFAQNNDIFEVNIFIEKCDPACVFEPRHVNSETVKLFPRSCETVCAYLLFDESTDVSDNELSGIFQNMRNLFGFVHVMNTNFTNLKFLEGLESLECNYNDNLVIQSNKYITEIGIESLQGVLAFLYFLTTDRLSIVITNNSPNFCLTIQETNNMFYAQIFEHDMISASICDFNQTSIEDQKLCKIDNFDLTNFNPKCQRVFGTVLVNEGDELLVGKLNNIKWIYGELVINGTKLETIDFLDSLEHVVSLDAKSNIHNSSPAIFIYNNQKLSSASFPSLMTVIGGSSPFQFVQNNESLTFNPEICTKSQKGMNTIKQVPTIDGKTCVPGVEKIILNSTADFFETSFLFLDPPPTFPLAPYPVPPLLYANGTCLLALAPELQCSSSR